MKFIFASAFLHFFICIIPLESFADPCITSTQTANATSWPPLEWGPGNPTSITPNTSRSISVVNGFPPYVWEITGGGCPDGFSLIQEETTDLTNTLSQGPDGCWVQIQVTDQRGDTATGSLRSTNGEWVLKSNTCSLTGPNPKCTSTGSCIDPVQCGFHPGRSACTRAVLILDNKKQIETATCSRGSCSSASYSRGNGSCDYYRNNPDCLCNLQTCLIKCSWGVQTRRTSCSVLSCCAETTGLFYYEWECQSCP